MISSSEIFSFCDRVCGSQIQQLKRATLAMTNIPEELILKILECACSSIIQDLAATPPPPSAAPLLSHFLHLRLACKTFNRILTYSVLVEHQPIQQWLLNWQRKKFNYLKPEDRMTVQDIHRACGKVWYNPSFLICFDSHFWALDTARESEEVLIWFLYLAPELFANRLTLNDEYLNRTEIEEQSIQPRIAEFREYGREAKEFEFTPGKYEFPEILLEIPYMGWFGTSVLSFRSPRSGLTVSGPGPFWLWYRSIWKSECGSKADICEYRFWITVKSGPLTRRVIDGKLVRIQW